MSQGPNPQPDEQPLDLPLGSREQLEEALDLRTQPTTEDAARMGELSGLDLRQAVYRATDAVSVFDDLLLQLQDEDFRLDEALLTVEENALTDEHQWRLILETLAAAGDEADELRAVGLVKYRRYLRNRLEALETRQGELNGGGAPGREVSAQQTQVVGNALDLELDFDLEPEADGAEQQSEAASASGRAPAPSPADSAPLQLEDLAEAGHEAGADPVDQESGPTRLLKLHRGKPVALSVSGRDSVDLWLGKSRFRLMLGQSLRLLSESGRECGRLQDGRSLIGRSPDCEIVIDPRHDTVSRVHLEVAVEEGRLVAVTDLSSGGTYVRPELVPRRTNAA